MLEDFKFIYCAGDVVSCLYGVSVCRPIFLPFVWTILPNSLGNITTLKALSLDGNPLACVTKKAFLHIGTEEILKYLHERMEEVALGDEEEIIQSTNEARTSTLHSTELHNLTYTNGLSEKEKQIMAVTKFLDYSSRQVEDIPDEVLSAALECRVHTIKLNRNYFTTIPIRIKDFLHLLMELDLSYNRLSELPSFIGYSPHLKVLDIQNNQLNSLPSEITNLKQLVKMNIGHNRRLQLFGNPFRQPRASIINRGTASVLEWLRDRLPVESSSF